MFYKQRQTIENYFRDSNGAEEVNKLPSQRFRANEAYLWLTTIVQNALVWFKRSRQKFLRAKTFASISVCLKIGNLVPIKKFVPELINRKALVFVPASYIQINFSIYFKYKEVHDLAAKRLEIIKEALESVEPLGNSWKFTTKISLPKHLKIEAPKQK